jgi:hypothetical protein
VKIRGLDFEYSPVLKKNGKLRVCIDFRDLNKATPMDGYPMLIADLLVDVASRHKVISFMDGMWAIIKFSRPKKTFLRLLLGALELLVCMSGWS